MAGEGRTPKRDNRRSGVRVTLWILAILWAILWMGTIQKAEAATPHKVAEPLPLVGPCAYYHEDIKFEHEESGALKYGDLTEVRIRLKYLNTRQEIYNELIYRLAERGLQAKDYHGDLTTIRAFTYWATDRYKKGEGEFCYITVLKPESVDDFTLCDWGHELAHCVIGMDMHVDYYFEK